MINPYLFVGKSNRPGTHLAGIFEHPKEFDKMLLTKCQHHRYIKGRNVEATVIGEKTPTGRVNNLAVESISMDTGRKFMPIFEYVCQNCDNAFEVLIQGQKQPTCPSCGSQNLEKQFSAFAVQADAFRTAAQEPAGPCASCGDPRGAGACSLLN